MYLYVFSAPSYGRHDLVKIGVSKNPRNRLINIRSTHDRLMKIVAIYESANAFGEEAKIKRRFKDKRRIGHEHFAVDVNEVLAFIKQECEAVLCQ